jgi:5,10-methylenetetrahydromethanopterin reductase
MIEISCAFATSLHTPEHVVVAESLGYRRAWRYDSPALYPDVWIVLARRAERTSRIGLGPAVLIPSLRHPMTNAAAIATLVDLAPGRVSVAIGSGFTGRMTMGQRPLSWKFVRRYVLALQALLRGEVVAWEGSTMQMMHPGGFAAARPIEVPMLLGIAGPKGAQVAAEIADGIFVTGPRGNADGNPGMCVALTFGTVQGDGEDAGSARVVDAAGHGASVALHAMYERGADLSRIPGGEAWHAELETIPSSERHISLHDLHLIGVSKRDAPLITGGLMRQLGLARAASEWRDYLAQLEAVGTTEIAYQPAGADIPGELERFAKMAGI